MMLKKHIHKTLIVFQFDISGNDIKVLHPRNIHARLLTLEVFHFDKSVNLFNEIHL